MVRYCYYSYDYDYDYYYYYYYYYYSPNHEGCSRWDDAINL